MDAVTRQKTYLELAEQQGEPEPSRRAYAAVLEIQEKIVAAKERLAAVEAEVSSYAYDAVLTAGSSPSRRSLTRLQGEAAALRLELEALSAGLDQARVRLQASRAAGASRQRRADAEHALELSRELDEQAQLCSEALIAFGARYEKFRSIARELNQLGFGVPRDEIVRLAAERGVRTALAPFRLASMLQPGSRVTLAEIGKNYARQAEAAARKELDGEAA